MAKSKHPKYYSRKFLNKGKGTALIEASVDITSYSMDATVCISDCYRKVELDMHIYNKQTLKEKSEKIDLLIKELNIFKDFINNNSEYFLKLKENNKGKDILSRLEELEDD